MKYTEKELTRWVLQIKDRYLCPYMQQRGREVIKMGWIPPTLNSICDRVYDIDHRCYIFIGEGDFSGYYDAGNNHICLNPVFLKCEGDLRILKTPLHELAHLYQHKEGLIPEYVSGVKDVLDFERPAEVWAWWVFLSLLEERGNHTTGVHSAPSYFNQHDITWVKKQYGWG